MTPVRPGAGRGAQVYETRFYSDDNRDPHPDNQACPGCAQTREIRFYNDDDHDPDPADAIAVVPHAHRALTIGQGITLVGVDGIHRRYRIVDVDDAYTAHTGNTYTESGVAVYVIDADDPRRLGA